jgi:SAM-dependent methyltransferase
MAWDGDRYQQRFDQAAAQGADVHGEADFVARMQPAAVLDAGCGTGRVAIELARRGVAVVGLDVDASMLATARRRGPDVTWVEGDLATASLGRTFDIVVMAGNVVLFTAAGSEGAVVAGCARHIAAGGFLVAGFQLGRRYQLATYDRHCHDAGLELVERWASWDRDPMPADGGDYAVSVHQRSRGLNASSSIAPQSTALWSTTHSPANRTTT